MKNTLIHLSSHSLRHSPQAVSSLKTIVFAIGNLSLALRIEQVYKVLGQTLVYGTGFDRVGIAHVGDREVTVVDLNQQLSGSTTTGLAKARYLVVAQNIKSELVGIPVAIVPTLKEVSLSNIRVLPESYRHAALLGIATHVCQVSEEVPLTKTSQRGAASHGGSSSLTLFLLDVDRLLEIR